MKWSFDSDRPIYAQIIDHMRLFIASGEYKAGEKLPSVREIAQEAGVNPNTMQRAFAELESQGLVFANRTSGRFITEDEGMIKELKKELASDAIRTFLDSMKQIGYNKNETVELMKYYIEERGKGDE